MINKLVVALSCLAFSFSSLASDGDIHDTKFGKLSIGLVDDQQVLFFKGKQVNPKIEGNSSLSFEKSFRIADSEVVLLQNTGGTACPALFTLVTVTSQGISQSPEFGTCSDLIKSTQSGDKLIFSMPSMQRRGKTNYVFENGKLTENGKPLK